MIIKINIVLDTDIQEDLDILNELGEILRLGRTYDTRSESQKEGS